MPEHGPGPYEAVQEFLREDPTFQIDKTREKFLLTYFPDGFLKRVAAPSTAVRVERPASR
jgi:cephalosporin hydroxylase